MSERSERVSKIDAAKRQLREAILLFLERRDAVAIHTLAAASHQILVDLASERGVDGILKNTPFVRPEKRKEWISLVNSAHNFFKHADRDSEATLEFDPSITAFFIFDAVQIYQHLAGTMTREQLAFFAWFMAKYPQFLQDSPLKDSIAEALSQGLDTTELSPLLAIARGEEAGT